MQLTKAMKKAACEVARQYLGRDLTGGYQMQYLSGPRYLRAHAYLLFSGSFGDVLAGWTWYAGKWVRDGQ